ncbi:MAG: hypothetical protein ACR2NX_13365 [Chthoniobacterales bacterium]
MKEENRLATLKYLRWTIWTYFWLLVFEGSLRKWVVPQLATPLLIVRDPVVLMAYAFALRLGIFPRNKWVDSLLVIALISFLIAFIPLVDYVPPLRIVLVATYGLRCDFLHLPMIFLIPAVLRLEDVKKFGWWFLLLIPPMALLMAAQFQASPDSFLNRTASGEGEMMMAALGKVRTAGPFSFVVGVVSFFALATGFLLWAALKRKVYPLWLLYAAAAGLAIGGAVCGSRTVVATCAVVVASLGFALVLRPSSVTRLGQVLVGVVVLGWCVSKTPIYREGLMVLSTRFNSVAEANETSIGGSLLDRLGDDFEDSFVSLKVAPFWGYGLGVGTNGGGKFLSGHAGFLLSEVEWSRIVLEGGPLFGLAFVVWRISLAFYLGWLCLISVRRSGNLLPLLLFSSTSMLLINGQFGQPTIAGFAVLGAGLTLAARRLTETEAPADSGHPSGPVREAARLPRSSPYARRLQETASSRNQANGFVDR